MTPEMPSPEATPQAVMAEEDAMAESSLDAAIGTAPVPADAISVSDYHGLVKSLNAAMGAAIPGSDSVSWTAPPRVTATKEPLPPEVWRPLAALGGLVQQFASTPEGAALADYVFDPMAVGTSDGINAAIRALDGLARDKAAQKILSGAIAPPMEEEPTGEEPTSEEAKTVPKAEE